MVNLLEVENVLMNLKGTKELLSLFYESTLSPGVTLDKERTQEALIAIEKLLSDSICDLSRIVGKE